MSSSPVVGVASPLGQLVRAAKVDLDGREVSVAIVLPALNEELTIGQAIKDFHQQLPAASIVVVDNNSTDRTHARALEAFEATGANGLVLTEPRQGKGHAARRALRRVLADVYVLADADMTYPADRVRDLVRPVANDEADMVVGNRLSGGRYAAENKRRFHGLGNWLVLFMINRLFRAHLGDIMSGYRALSGSFVAGYPMLVYGFELETDMTLHALDKHLRILEIPIEYRDRPAGSRSKLQTFGDGRRVLSSIIALVRYYRPLLFFGGGAGLLGSAGLVAAIPVITDWLDYRYIYHVPLAVLATGLEIVALLSLGIGLILDSVARAERMAYELDVLARQFRPPE